MTSKTSRKATGKSRIFLSSCNTGLKIFRKKWPIIQIFKKKTYNLPQVPHLVPCLSSSPTLLQLLTLLSTKKNLLSLIISPWSLISLILLIQFYSESMHFTTEKEFSGKMNMSMISRKYNSIKKLLKIKSDFPKT